MVVIERDEVSGPRDTSWTRVTQHWINCFLFALLYSHFSTDNSFQQLFKLSPRGKRRIVYRRLQRFLEDSCVFRWRFSKVIMSFLSIGQYGIWEFESFCMIKDPKGRNARKGKGNVKSLKTLLLRARSLLLVFKSKNISGPFALYDLRFAAEEVST